MPKILKLTNHLETEELKKRYRKSRDVHEMRRWHVLWLVSQGRRTKEVADIVAMNPQSVRTIVWRYNDNGPLAVFDQRKLARGGRPPILDEELQGLLAGALSEPLADGEAWTGPRVADWISEHLGREVPPSTGWRYLKRLGSERRRV